MLNIHKNSCWPIAIAVLLMSITMIPAHADDDDDDSGRSMSSTKYTAQAGDTDAQNRRGGKSIGNSLDINAKLKDECGSCHMVYPPRFLSAQSWRAVMAGLDKHFGSDASVDAAAAAEIGDFLVQNASTKKRTSASGIEPALRITETRWFQSEHRKMDSKWKDPRVKSSANCAACHTRAESGSFKERDIKVPK